MGLKIFLTGATGFIGGDFLYCATQAHPEWQFTCLVRNSNKGAKVLAAYPAIRLVYGDLDSNDLLIHESSIADVVVHTASDEHVNAARSIIQGLHQRQPDRPTAFYIHTSGAFSLALQTIDTNSYGHTFPDKIYDDLDGIDELINLPERAPHRKVDNLILAEHNPTSKDHVPFKTAIVAPSVIYGRGRGPVKTTSVPFLGIFAGLRKTIMISPGDNVWHYVHVQDLSQIYLALVESAAEALSDGNGISSASNTATWNLKGYYLAENGSYTNREMLALVARLGFEKGLFDSPVVETMSAEEVDKVNPWLKIMIGVDSRGRARRARELLGWRPSMPGFMDVVGELLDGVKKELGAK